MQLLPNGNAGNRETAPEICLDKDSDHEAAFFFGKMARTCSDAAFPSRSAGKAASEQVRAIFPKKKAASWSESLSRQISGAVSRLPAFPFGRSCIPAGL